MRLADLVAGLSRLADLGFGLQAGVSVRASALAAMLGRSLDLPDDDVRAGLYTGLLFHVGCVGYAHETARLFGDEFALNVAAERTDLADPRDLALTLVPRVARGRTAVEQTRVAITSLTRGKRFGRAFDTASCEVGRDAARRLRLPGPVQRSVYHSSEWWNGRGAPGGLGGEEIPPGARLAMLASTAALFDGVGGPEAAVEAVRRRRGGILDPGLVDAFVARADELLGHLAAHDPYEQVLELEPPPVATVPGPRLTELATVLGDLGDLKTPFTHGHARGVARLARAAGERCGVAASDLDDLELAGLLHDVGRVAVSAAVWEKPGRLTAGEWEQVRLHAYHSERILAASQRLSPLIPLVGAHHERGDGLGYHRGAPIATLPFAARLLAAADAFHAMTQPRPHRRARAPEEAERELLDEARSGSLDADAVHAVLAAAGRDAPEVRREPPAGLTDREVEVLALLAGGSTNKQIAARLVVSPRTAESHVQQIYRKIGSSSRAAAAMFAMEHGLVSGRGP